MAFKKKVVAEPIVEKVVEIIENNEEKATEPLVEETTPTEGVEEVLEAETPAKDSKNPTILEQIEEICQREVKMVGDYKIYRTHLHIVVECQKDVMHLYELVKKLPVDQNIKHANLGTHKSLYITEL